MHDIESRVANREFSPEYVVTSVSELVPEIMDDCIYNGATKISGVFDPEFASSLSGKMTDYWLMRLRFSEIRALGRYVKSQLGESGIVIPEVDVDPKRHNIPSGISLGSMYGHVDNRPRGRVTELTGVSALIPVAGPRAVFGAQETKFDHRYEKSGPKMLWEYGLGDMMLVRQRIDYFRGKRVNKPQAYHFGFSEDARKLLMVDFTLMKLGNKCSCFGANTTAVDVLCNKGCHFSV